MNRQPMWKQVIGVGVILLLMAGCGKTRALEAGETRIDERSIEQVWVPAGSFLMGTADTVSLDPPFWATRELESEQPQHEVHINHGFWIDKYEVTHAAFQAFIDDGGYAEEEHWSEDGFQWLSRQKIERLLDRCPHTDTPDHPRVCITWYEAEAYAHWRGGRLPTEAEWEYPARGPESLIYPWGDTFDSRRANVVDSDGLTPRGLPSFRGPAHVSGSPHWIPSGHTRRIPTVTGDFLVVRL